MKCNGCGNTEFVPTPDKMETVVKCLQCHRRQLKCQDCLALEKEVARLSKISQCEHGIPWDTDCDICNSANKNMAKFISRHYNPANKTIQKLKAMLKDPEQTKDMRCPECYMDGGAVMVSLYDVIRELESVTE